MGLGYIPRLDSQYFQLKQLKVGWLLNVLLTPWFPAALFRDSQETASAKELECFHRDVGDFTKAWTRYFKIEDLLI